MREAIGGTWIFQVVIGFILLFTAFICLAVNRSKAFAVKDQIIQVIQSYNGINVNESYDETRIDAMYDIVDYIKASSYRNTGVRPANVEAGDETYPYYCFNRNGASDDRHATFCIAPISVRNDGCNVSMSPDCGELPSMYYYKVVVFYQLDIPIFREVFNFRITGDTKTMLGEAR